MPWVLSIFSRFAKNASINCSDYARVLNIPQYSYNKITIVIIVIMFEFFSVRFVHPNALLPFYLFLT